MQVEYPDPDGDRTYCLNSEVGDLTLEVERRGGRFARWERVATLTSTGTTHVERASRERHPGVPIVGQSNPRIHTNAHEDS